MTRAIPFTQAAVYRAIKAVQKAGLPVRGVRPDGTVIVGQPDELDSSQRDVDALEPKREIVL